MEKQKSILITPPTGAEASNCDIQNLDGGSNALVALSIVGGGALLAGGLLAGNALIGSGGGNTTQAEIVPMVRLNGGHIGIMHPRHMQFYAHNGITVVPSPCGDTWHSYVRADRGPFYMCFEGFPDVENGSIWGLT
ncbi:MAG: hypothetical protein FWB72_06915 [Firmicutes bacterium]|nr:hypothetical protein [Bacillota bacterium]